MNEQLLQWSDLGIWTSILLGLIYILTLFFTIWLIILEKRNPANTVSWIMVLAFLPVIGFIFFIFLGRNYRKDKIFSRKGLKDLANIRQIERQLNLDLKIAIQKGNESVAEKQNIIRLLMNNNKAILSRFNNLQVLENGRATFYHILHELDKAVHHIHIEYYIFEYDEIGKQITDILIRKAREGVEVRIILDDVGCWDLSKEFFRVIEEAGISHYKFMPVHFPMLTSKVNYRNHRKIIIIDGKTGFVGGINIADRYMEQHPKLGFWRDTHLMIEGDGVKSLQLVFFSDWYFVSNDLIYGEPYFPETNIVSEHYLQIAASGPDSDWASIMQSYFAAIGSARKNIYISTPYFTPNESILMALKTAALSGVQVKIIIPEKSDSKLLNWCSRSYIEELLESGVRIYFYKKGFNHGKLIMVDGLFSSIGTANMDIRSFDQNFEVNALLYDEQVTRQLEGSFMLDLQNSEEVNPDQFKRRVFVSKLKESIARILSPLM